MVIFSQMREHPNHLPVGQLVPWSRNPRINEDAVEDVARSIQRFGFGAPIVARAEDFRVIAGHTRLKAAKKLGLTEVPVRLMHISEEDADKLAIADNKIGERATWDESELAAVMDSFSDSESDTLGFSGDPGGSDGLSEKPESKPEREKCSLCGR